MQRVSPAREKGLGIAIAARLGSTFGVTRLGVPKVEAEGHSGNDAGGAGSRGLQARRLQARQGLFANCLDYTPTICTRGWPRTGFVQL